MIEYGEDVDKDVCVAVSVVTAPYVPIEIDLLNRGYKAVIPFYDLTEHYRDRHPLANGWYANHFNLADRQAIRHVIHNLADVTSVGHYLAFLAWRRLREEWSFALAPMPSCPRFFIPEVTSVLHKNEVFVDGGAHFGGVSLEFMKQTKGTFKTIFAIEPDPKNREMFEITIGHNDKVKMYSCALAEHQGIANFHGGLGYASQLATTGHQYVITYPLDALNLKPTFVKLHLEGGELAALKGARHTLLAHRPILATTVYHNADGLWKTAMYLMEHLADYRFLFRAHNWCATGAVIYAIPNERYQ